MTNVVSQSGAAAQPSSLLGWSGIVYLHIQPVDQKSTGFLLSKIVDGKKI